MTSLSEDVLLYPGRSGSLEYIPHIPPSVVRPRWLPIDQGEVRITGEPVGNPRHLSSFALRIVTQKSAIAFFLHVELI